MDRGNGQSTINYIKAGFTIVIAVYGIICARDVTIFRFLDRVDLVAHEAGHLLLSYLGEFVMIFGGTAGQLFVPAAITCYFAAKRQFYSSTVTLFWLGQNMFNISVYVSDASAMALPLVSVGGGDALHDWNYLLTRTGLLHADRLLGGIVYGAGVVTIAVSVALGFYFSLEREREREQMSDEGRGGFYS